MLVSLAPPRCLSPGPTCRSNLINDGIGAKKCWFFENCTRSKAAAPSLEKRRLDEIPPWGLTMTVADDWLQKVRASVSNSTLRRQAWLRTNHTKRVIVQQTMSKSCDRSVIDAGSEQMIRVQEAMRCKSSWGRGATASQKKRAHILIQPSTNEEQFHKHQPPLSWCLWWSSQKFCCISEFYGRSRKMICKILKLKSCCSDSRLSISRSSKPHPNWSHNAA